MTTDLAARIRARGRKAMTEGGDLICRAIKSKTKGPTRFEQCYDYREPVHTSPFHRHLAIRRGEREGVLRVEVDVDVERVLCGVA